MKHFNSLFLNAVTLAVFIAWIMGVVLAKGFWATAFACCIPFYAWYLVAERLMLISGFGI